MYHKFNKIIEEVKNKRVLELDFDSQQKFKSLKKKRLTFSRSAFVTIQEGCDKFCSFCVVPFTRGAEASAPLVKGTTQKLQNLSQPS